MKRTGVSMVVLLLGILLQGCISVTYVVTELPNKTDIQSPQGSPSLDLEVNQVTPSLTVTFSPSPSPSPSRTVSPSPTNTITPSLTLDLEETQMVVTIENAACYSGPGNNYLIVSYINLGDQIILIGQNLKGDWFYIQEKIFNRFCWINHTKVDIQLVRADLLPMFTAQPPPTMTPTGETKPTKRSSPRDSEDDGSPTPEPPYPPPYPVDWQ